MTFSIAARVGEAWGVAVASKFPAVGSVVPRVTQGVCAVATQSFARVAYLDELELAITQSMSAPEAVTAATAADPGRETRQLGVVSLTAAATFTGTDCMPWAGGRAHADGDTAYAIQGNLLSGPEVVAAMERAFLESEGASLDRRLLAALLAGDDAGGDARGRQGAALLVRSPGAGYDASGVLADLRVDDHDDAVRELARLHAVHELSFRAPEEVHPWSDHLRAEVADLLSTLGREACNVESALEAWLGEANLEERHSPGGVDVRVLEELRRAVTSEIPTCTGDLVTLQPMSGTHAARLHALMQDPEVAVLTGSVHSSAARDPLPFTPRDLNVILERWRRDPRRAAWVIVERASGEVVGELILMDRDEDNRSCGLRLWISGATGRGLGTEAIRLALDFAFTAWECERVELEVFDHNPRARHVYEKIGFVHEGTRRHALLLDGHWVDAHVMGLLRAQWRATSRGHPCLAG